MSLGFIPSPKGLVKCTFAKFPGNLYIWCLQCHYSDSKPKIEFLQITDPSSGYSWACFLSHTIKIKFLWTIWENIFQIAFGHCVFSVLDCLLSPELHDFWLDLGISLVCFWLYFGTPHIWGLSLILLKIDCLALCTICSMRYFDLVFSLDEPILKCVISHYCVFLCNDSIFWTDCFILFFKWELANSVQIGSLCWERSLFPSPLFINSWKNFKTNMVFVPCLFQQKSKYLFILLVNASWGLNTVDLGIFGYSPFC